MKKKNLFYIIFLIQYLLFFNSSSFSKDWFTSSGDYSSLKYSRLDIINKNNLEKLSKAWVFKNGFVPDKNAYFRNNNQATPIFTGKSLITTSLDGFIISLNPENGKEVWRTKIENPAAKRGLTYFKGNIYVPSGNGIYVINESDGSIKTEYGDNGIIKNNNNPKSLVPPIILENKMIVAYINSVASHNLPSGKINWELDLNGARVWSGVSYDKENESLVFVTSNLVNLVGNTEIENDYSNSLVVVDGLTGKLRCRFKDTIHDHWDLDMVGNPIITKANNFNIAYGFSKTGNIFKVNISNCELLNKDSIEKIVTENNSPIENQVYSNYQIKVNDPENIMDLNYDLTSYLVHISNDKENLEYVKHRTRNSKYGESFIPLSLNYDTLMYGLHGGPEWPGGSYDLINNQIIIPTNHYPWVIRTYYTCCKKNKPSALRKAQQSIINLKHFEAHSLYKSKCSSCHRKNKNGRYVREFVGDKYIPSLNGISKLEKMNSLKSIKNFKYSHKYTEKIDISDAELKILNDYFLSHDSYLIDNNLLKLSATWQLLLDKNGNFASIPPHGKLTAINLDNGKISWQIPFGEKIINGNDIKGDINFGGVLTTKGNISIATGTPDKNVYIYDTQNGEELWRTKLDFAGSSPPMTYIYKGEQYIVINSSGGKYYGYEKDFGDLIYAFKLKN